MPFHPDIVVTEPGSFHSLIIVEVKSGTLTSDSEAQLRAYMWEMSCPVGLLVSPKQIFLYQNRFTGYSSDSVEKVGSYPAPANWSGYGSRGQEWEFERQVERWLKGLADHSDDLPTDAAEAMQRVVLPGLLQGDIHAARPRVSR